MSDAEHSYSVDQDPHRLLTMILYVLYIVAIFSAGILAVIALIINYLKRGDEISNTQSTMEIEDLISKFVTGGAGESKAKDSGDAGETQTSSDTASAEPSFVE